MWHWDVSTPLAEALTAHEDSGWRTRVLVIKKKKCARPRHSPHFLPLTLGAYLSTRLDIHCMTDLEEIIVGGWVPSRSCNFASLIRRWCLVVEKAGAVGSSGRAKFQDHGTLYHALIGFLAERLGLGSRELRGPGDLGDPGGNAASVYYLSLHQ